MGEPSKKKQKPNQSNLTGITSEEIKWYSNRHPVGKSSLLAKHEHMLKVYFVKSFFFHMAQEKSVQIYDWERYGYFHLFSVKWEKSTAWE